MKIQVTLRFGTTIFGTLRDNLPTAEMRIIGGGKINNGMKTVGHQMIEFNRSVNLGSEWTIETWFKTPLNGGTPYNILVRGKKDHIIMTADYLHGTYLLGTWEDPVKTGRDGWKPCDFNSSTPGIQGLDLNDPYFQANTWHHLIAVGKGLTTTFYIDSMMSPDSTELKKCVSNYKSMDDVMNIGNNDESDSRYSWGFIDDFRVYNNALEEEKIKTLADNCSFTTTALPGKILIKKCLSVPTVHEQEPTVVWEPIENEICIGYCTNDALRLGVVANADAITYSVSGVKKNFCYVEKLEKTDAASPLNFSNFTAIKALNGDEPDNTVNADANCTDTSAIEASARRACCQTGYYVFDFNASTDGKQEMVCCRYNNMVPCSLDKQCASPNKCIEGSC
ncbi:MAG: hypothetical protein NT116_06390, partial [Candidatus Parcubacteria bacterium]|nr:hypothetical protein [Candidatus Parcubacteria bacterium]